MAHTSVTLPVTLPENAQDSIIHSLYSHLKTTVKLHIAVVRGVSDYKSLNMHVSHFYCICSLQFYSIVQKNKYTTVTFLEQT